MGTRTESTCSAPANTASTLPGRMGGMGCAEKLLASWLIDVAGPRVLPQRCGSVHRSSHAQTGSQYWNHAARRVHCRAGHGAMDARQPQAASCWPNTPNRPSGPQADRLWPCCHSRNADNAERCCSACVIFSCILLGERGWPEGPEACPRTRSYCHTLSALVRKETHRRVQQRPSMAYRVWT